MTRDEDSDVRVAAAEAIGRLGAAAGLPLLHEMSSDWDSRVRQAAAAAIGRLGSADDLPRLREMTREEHEGVHVAAAHAIGRVGSADDLALLREMTRDEHSGVRLAAAHAIGRVGSADDLALLREMTRDEDSDVRRAALRDLLSLAKREDRVGLLAESLLHDCEDDQVSAAIVAGELAPRDAVLAFIDQHGEGLRTRTLAVFDWFLYAPAYLKEAYARETKEAEEGEDPSGR
jgi:HEAT repeat protein